MSVSICLHSMTLRPLTKYRQICDYSPTAQFNDTDDKY